MSSATFRVDSTTLPPRAEMVTIAGESDRLGVVLADWWPARALSVSPSGFRARHMVLTRQRSMGMSLFSELATNRRLNEVKGET